ncbi:MAG: hypothetical protein ACOYO9_01870 [Candidatus Nanopelagicales bacterium]
MEGTQTLIIAPASTQPLAKIAVPSNSWPAWPKLSPTVVVDGVEPVENLAARLASGTREVGGLGGRVPVLTGLVNDDRRAMRVSTRMDADARSVEE